MTTFYTSSELSTEFALVAPRQISLRLVADTEAFGADNLIPERYLLFLDQSEDMITIETT